MTKRPLNHCKRCGKTWYPRGHDLSSKCPNCGHREIKAAGGVSAGVIIFLLLAALVGGGKHDSPKPDVPVASSAPASDQAAKAASGFIQQQMDQPTVEGEPTPQASDGADAASRFIQSQVADAGQSVPPETISAPGAASPSAGAAPIQSAGESI